MTPKKETKASTSKEKDSPSFVIGKKKTHTAQASTSQPKAATSKPRRRSTPFTAKDLPKRRPKRAGGATAKKGTSPKKSSNSRKRQLRVPQKKVLRTTLNTTPSSTKSLPLSGDTVRIIPLGGVEEVGKNMTVVEYRDSIVIVDAGVQFREPDTPGIDFIIPNTKYLEERKKKIKALVITHGHLDHIGGIPYIMNRIGNPPIYSRNLTTLLIKKRQEEFPHEAPLNIKVIETNDEIDLGDLKLKFFAVTHTIPDSMGVMIETPYGNIVHTGDLKLDHVDGVPTEFEQGEFDRVSKENNLMLCADSTNVERPGFSIPEARVQENILEIIRGINGRLIVGTFASLLERLMKIIEYADQLERKIIVDGRSMKNNVEVAIQAGLISEDIVKRTMIPIEQMASYPPEKIIILATGAQGDEFAALMRAANKKHKYLKINKNDTVLLSSSIVPGNERSVQKLKDNLSRQGARIIHYMVSDVHSSGHANRDESAWIHKHVGAKFFLPMHGYHYMLRVHADIARSIGMPEENFVIPDNGMIIDIMNKGQKLVVNKESAPSNPVMVDGFSVADSQEVVLRDRKALAEDGIFVVIASFDSRTGKVRKSPDIISRGFVYLRESQDLLRQARYIAKKTIEDNTIGVRSVNYEYLKDQVTDSVEKFLLQKTAKRPMVLPVIIAV